MRKFLTTILKSLIISRYQHKIPNLSTPKIQNNIKMITLSVDGNISSGKSTVVSMLLQFFNNGSNFGNKKEEENTVELKNTNLEIEVIPEPLDKWCDLKGYNLLEMYYKDPEKNNFRFEHYVQLTRLMDMVKKSDDEEQCMKNSIKSKLHIRLMERSLQNNRYCFLELSKKSGKLHPAEFAVLAEWYNWMETHFNIDLDLIIYLQTKPKTAYERMKARARNEEDLCPYEYLVDLHESYEDWLIRKPNPTISGRKTHIIVLDGNKSKEEVGQECFQKLNEYLHNVTKKG